MSADPADAPARAAGGCLCGAVSYRVVGPLRDVVLCHCRMCRRTHGHVGAYTAAAKADIRLIETRGLRWYRSSDTARRGFCAECGASLFWEAAGRDTMSIAAGTLDAPTGLNLAYQIHVADAGDYYPIAPDIERRSSSFAPVAGLEGPQGKR